MSETEQRKASERGFAALFLAVCGTALLVWLAFLGMAVWQFVTWIADLIL